MGDVLALRENVTSDGIEPPLSDLESEVLPLHHEAFRSKPLPQLKSKTNAGATAMDRGVTPSGYGPFASLRSGSIHRQ